MRLRFSIPTTVFLTLVIFVVGMAVANQVAQHFDLPHFDISREAARDAAPNCPCPRNPSSSRRP